MAELSVQTATLTGVEPTYVAASAGGDTVANNGGTALSVKNGSAAAITVTVDSVTACNYGFDHDISASVPAGAERLIGPFNQTRFGTTLAISYSAVTSVTIAAIRVA